MEAKAKVLVVDDEDRFRENMVRLLNGQDMFAAGASSGLEALDVLQKEEFDVVLLDMKMPEMNGMQTLAAIRRLDLPLQVVVLSGHASVDDAMEMMGQGAFDYLIKPCATDRLVKKVRQAYLEKRVVQGKADIRDITGSEA
ncbi:MAG: response regulator [Desulfovibrionaceae bacterium]